MPEVAVVVPVGLILQSFCHDLIRPEQVVTGPTYLMVCVCDTIRQDDALYKSTALLELPGRIYAKGREAQAAGKPSPAGPDV